MALALAASFAIVLGIGHIWLPASNETQAAQSAPIAALLVLALLALLWLAYIAVAPARAAIPDVLQHRWRNFFDLSTDWYWEMDADLRFTYFSENLPNITGTDARRALGRRREDVIHPSMLAADSGRRISPISAPIAPFAISSTAICARMGRCAISRSAASRSSTRTENSRAITATAPTSPS